MERCSAESPTGTAELPPGTQEVPFDLQQAGGVVGALSVRSTVEEFADPIEEGVQLAHDRRELSVGGSTLP